MYKPCPYRTRGLTLIEVAVVMVSIALLAAILLPATGKSRATNWVNQDLANLRTLSQGMQSYVLDYQDLLPNFTQVNASIYPDVVAQPGDSQTTLAAKHAAEIIRRRGDRGNSFPVRLSWLPHVLYSHLVIADYLEMALPSEAFVSPSDLVRSKWMNWNEFENDLYAPLQPSPGINTAYRYHPYQSSYLANLASYDRLASVLDSSVVVRRIRPASTEGTFHVPSNSELGGTTLATVQHPSRKVYYNASEQFNFKGKRIYYAVDEAQVAMTFFDGSASFRQTGSANLGWNPQQPTHHQFLTYYSQDNGWQAPVTGTFSPTLDRIVNRYSTTRDGLFGIDY